VITLERKPLFRATSNIHDPAGTGWQLFVRMDAQKIRKPADMVPVAVGYEDRIYGRRVDAEPFHIAEEDVAPGPVSNRRVCPAVSTREANPQSGVRVGSRATLS
jgi:hypothetical protein